MTIPILIANVLSNWIDDIVIKSDIAKILRYTINISDIKISDSKKGTQKIYYLNPLAYGNGDILNINSENIMFWEKQILIG